MREQKLKDLLKSPFKCNATGNIYGNEGGGIAHLFTDFLPKNKNGFPLRKIEKEYFNWAANAFNEKYKRDFSEPKRWILDEEEGSFNLWICPECDESYAIGCSGKHRFLYCPRCGQRLLPPKEK